MSVVIPCRNQAATIRERIEALRASTYPNIEIVVVDGMSRDGTRAVIQRLMEIDPRIRMVDNPQKLSLFFYNLGALHAGGDYVLYVGTDEAISVDYISILMDAVERRTRIGCTGGDVHQIYDTREGRYIALAMESPFGMGFGSVKTRYNDRYTDVVGVPMFNRDMLAETGPFDETMGEYQVEDMAYRLRLKLRKILYIHAAKATHTVKGNIRTAFWQFVQHGYMRVYVTRKYRKVTTLRHIVPPAVVAWFAIGFPASYYYPGLFTFIYWSAIVYLISGFIMVGDHLSFWKRCNVLFSCVVIHIAYGIGYWLGVFEFMLFRRKEPRLSFQRRLG